VTFPGAGSQPESEPPPTSLEPPFDPTSWSGAIRVMLGLTVVLWVVQFVNAANSYRLDRFGIRPREIDGLWGVLASPFLHSSYGHLLANTGPFVLLGWAILLSGLRPFLVVSAIVIVVGGLLTWLVASSGLIVGVSSLVMGWLGYLIARAVFTRRILWIVVAVLVFFFFGTLLGGLLPSLDSGVSWQGHVSGFVSGVLAGWLLHPRHPRSSRNSSRPVGGNGTVGEIA
jgi:membrane associated rhomboid family serine protease